MIVELDQAWETLLWAEATQHIPLLRPDAAGKAQVARLVQALSEGLTRKRALIGQAYLDRPEHLVPYLLYLLPTNAYRTRAVLTDNRLPSLLKHQQTLHIEELGCGPGTQLIGLLQALSLEDVPEGTTLRLCYQGTDWSRQALNSFERLIHQGAARGYIPRWIQVELALSHRPMSRWIPNACDLVLLGNVLNELEDLTLPEPSPALKQLWTQSLEALKPSGHLLLIEPSLQRSSWRVSQLRDEAAARNDVQLISPCTHHAPCPLAGPDRPAEQWCHQELRWERPPLLTALDALTGLNKQHFSLTHMLLRRSAPHTPADTPEPSDWKSYRVMSPPLASKGLHTLHLCGAAGFQEAVRLKRAIRPGNEAFADAQRGSRLWIRGDSARGERIRIEPETEVRGAAYEEVREEKHGKKQREDK